MSLAPREPYSRSEHHSLSWVCLVPSLLDEEIWINHRVRLKEWGKRKIITGTPKQTLLTCNFSFKCMTIHLVKNKLNSPVSGGPTRWSTFRVFQSKSHRKQGYVALPFWENPSAKTPYVTLDTLFPVTEVVFYTTCTWPPQGAVQGHPHQDSFPQNLLPHFTFKLTKPTSMFSKHLRTLW